MLIWTAALAAPLVHDGGAAEAIRLATEQTGTDGWESIPWLSVRSAPPLALAGSNITPCATGATTVDDALGKLTDAVLNALEVPSAVARAHNAAACFGATRAELSRIAFLAGVAAAEAGETEAATAYFRAALAIDSDLTWDPDFAERFSGPFDAAVQAGPGEQAEVHVLPRPGTIDGHPSPYAVSAGRHLVTTEGVSAWVETEGFPEVVVVPEALPSGALSWIEDDDRRKELSRLLVAKLGEGANAAIFTGGRTWTGRTGRADWTVHGEIVTPRPEPVAPTEAKRRRGPAPVVLASGLALAALGSGLSVGSYLYAKPKDGTTTRFATEQGRDSAASLYRIGNGVALGGGAIAAVGLVWTLGGR